jgi:AraC-like DNA-binding protein
MDAALFEMVAQIRHEAELALPGFRWRITSLCASGIVHLARQGTEHSAREMPQLSSNRRGVFLVSCAKEYLLRHLTNGVSLSDVAAHLQVSNGHLAHTFKRVAGQSLFTYFRQLRLEQAKLQLLNSEKNITEIAAACGFSSTTLFCRNFKQYTGHTPMGYRDELGANIEK